MSSPAVLDIDALVLPVPGDHPAGAPLADLLRFELDDLRKDADPLDPATAGRRADWPKVIKLAANALENRSKDYILGVRMLEAQTKKNGLPGLRDGLRLLHRLTVECWDRIHPTPEEGETMDVREGAFKWINDVSRGARFPQAVLEVPLVKGGGQAFAYVDSINERKGELEENTARLDPASVKLAAEQLEETQQALKDLAAALDERMGADVAPDFLSMETSTNIGSALAKCVELVDQLAKKRGVPLGDTAPADADDAPAADGGAATASGGGGGGTGIANSREGLYGQLARIATALKTIEPHSPVPYLLERCVKMGSLPFPLLMRAIIRENGVLTEVDRLIGVEKSDNNDDD